MLKRPSVHRNGNLSKTQKTQQKFGQKKPKEAEETRNKASEERAELNERSRAFLPTGQELPCTPARVPVWRLGAPPRHPHLPTPLSLNGLLCYRKQWETDNMTSNACVTHPPLDGGNNRWRENTGGPLCFTDLGLTHAGIYHMVT